MLNPMLDRRWFLALPVFAATLLLGACALMPPAATPMPAADWQRGLRLRSELPPSGLPAHAVPILHAQFVLLPAESPLGKAVDLLMPVPFVVDAVTDQINTARAKDLDKAQADLDPVGLVRQQLTLAGAPPLRADGLDTYVFAFAQECVDDRYRFALVAHLRTAAWNGRYMVHLPQSLPAAAFKRGDATTLAQLRLGMTEAAAALTQLLQRATRGELQPSGTRVDIGSLHLVGGKASGVISPTLIKARDIDLIEETSTTVLVRIAGDAQQAASAGGLLFGVHLLPRDQLHTYVRR